MTSQKIYHSPLICYEVTQQENSFGINVYFMGSKDACDGELHCEIKNFSNLAEQAHGFAQELAKSCALPVHVPELAEEFLSV